MRRRLREDRHGGVSCPTRAGSASRSTTAIITDTTARSGRTWMRWSRGSCRAGSTAASGTTRTRPGALRRGQIGRSSRAVGRRREAARDRVGAWQPCGRPASPAGSVRPSRAHPIRLRAEPAPHHHPQTRAKTQQSICRSGVCAAAKNRPNLRTPTSRQAVPRA